MTEAGGPAPASGSDSARVLVLPPTRRDGEIVERLLGQAGFTTFTCSTLAALSAAVDDATAAIVMTDDALSGSDLQCLRHALERQSHWSDVPFVVLASGRPCDALAELQSMASVTLLDRSVQMRTLLSAVQMAARARGRQYQIRDLLERERQARIDADRANQAKDRFLAMLSHELRTPLTPVVFALATLQREVDREGPVRRTIDARLPRLLEMIRRNIALETKLIDDLLDLSRLVQGKLQLQPVIVDLHARLRDTLAMVDSDARGKQLTIETTLEAGQHFVRADAARLHQVLWNLVKNAIKFTPDSGRITIRTWNDGDQLVMSCADTGIGIPPDVLPHIFEAFEQGSAEVTRHYGGLGLGLALGRSLVVAHGGTLTAASDGAGKGATFTMRLATVATVTTAAGSAPSPDPRRRPLVVARPLNILLVEDHADTAQALRESLTASGHRVRVAPAVAVALQEAAVEPCELLISDVGLPDGTGVDLLRRITPPPSLGAIAMSGFGMEADLARSRDAGFSRHLTKPVDLSELEEIIGQLVNADAAAEPAPVRAFRARDQPKRRD